MRFLGSLSFTFVLVSGVLLALSQCKKKESSNTAATSNTDTTSGGGTAGGTEATPSLLITGQIALSTALTSATAPDQIVAFPLSGGAAEPEAMGRLSEIDLESDGSFSVDLDSSSDASDFVLVLANSEAAEGEQFVNFMGFPTESGSNLLNLPMENADGTLDAGEVTLDASGTDATATTKAEAGAEAMGVTADVVTQFADTGSVLRVVKNYINNCTRNLDGRCVSANTTFTWTSNTTASLATFNEPTDWTYYGYSFILGFSNTRYSFTDVCAAGNPYLLTFYPPTAIAGSTSGGEAITVSSETGVSNSGLVEINTNSSGSKQCEYAGDTPGGYGYIGDNSSRFNFIPFSGASFTESIPVGNWRLTVANDGNGISETYNFDLASASPIDANGIARVWTPVVKITSDAESEVISKIEVKFYTYSPTAGWVETADTTALEAAIGGFGDDGNTSSGGIWFMFDDSGASTRLTEHVRLVPEAGTNILSASTFENTWQLPLASGATRVDSKNYATMRVSYDLRGTQINFGIEGR